MNNYLKDRYDMMKRGMKNISSVVEGVSNSWLDNFGLLDEDKKQEAERRYAICKQCPFNSLNAKQSPVGWYTNTREDEHCTACGCLIDKKVMSFDERCGLANINSLVYSDGSSAVYGWETLWKEYKQN